MQIDYTGATKLLVCIAVVISITLLSWHGGIDQSTAPTVLAAVLGYVFGNGHGIISAQQSNQGK